MYKFNFFRLKVFVALGAVVFVIAAGIVMVRPSAAAGDFDLVTEAIALTPAIPGKNVECELKVKIKNAGTVAVTESGWIGDYQNSFSGFTVNSVTLPAVSAAAPLNPGKVVYYVFKGTFSSTGNKTLSFMVNSQKALSESNYANNTLRTDATVILPDNLSVTAIKIYPEKISAGQEVRVTATIKNNGFRDLTNNFGVSDFTYDFPGFRETSRTTPNLSSANPLVKSGTVDYVFFGNFDSAGEKLLSFSLDLSDTVKESNENDNILNSAITVLGQDMFDLSMSGLSLSKSLSRLVIGEEIVITAKIKNAGSYSLTDMSGFMERDCEYDFGPFAIVKQEKSAEPDFDTPLDPGKTFEYKYTGSFTSPGPAELKFKIDKSGSFAEASESNNATSVPVIVYASAQEADRFAITGDRVMLLSSTSVAVVWATDKSASGEVYYRQSVHDQYSLNLVVPRITAWPKSNAGTSHSVTIKNLKPGQDYFFQAKGVNGEAVLSGKEMRFTMPLRDSLVFVTAPSAEISGSSATISWQTDMGASGYAYYRLKGGTTYIKSGTETITDRHTITLSGLAAGEYEYYVSGKASSGLKLDETRFYAFRIGADTEVDSTAPESTTPEVPADKPAAQVYAIRDKTLYTSLKGKILLAVEAKGEAYYVHPSSEKRYYLGRPDDAFSIMREQGAGIANKDLYKIPVGTKAQTGGDTDGDGIADYLEQTLGLNSGQTDTDGDGTSDLDELNSGSNPWGSGRQSLDPAFARMQAGRIFLQVEKNGEAWYISPADNKRYFLGRPADAFAVMRALGLGIANRDLERL